MVELSQSLSCLSKTTIVDREGLQMKTNRILGTAALAVASVALLPSLAIAAPACDPDIGGLKLPSGFCALVVADNLGSACHAWAAPSGDLYVALQKNGKSQGGVVAIDQSRTRSVQI